ncbi:MAG: hypothetical protein LC656_07275 [Sphingomonadales bacterium]|nr:hypothetical protein [Sphingomonadales bacterium]
MNRFARTAPVVVWEEPVDAEHGASPSLYIRPAANSANVTLITPRLPQGGSEDERSAMLRQLLDGYLAGVSGPLIAWYYTPMMLPFSRHLDPACTVYDCMDELANFRFAPRELLDLERELLERADVVFTGGYSLYESKKQRHGNVHPFPSSVDRAHFSAARGKMRRASSRRPRRPNISPPASRSSRPRSATSSAPMSASPACASPGPPNSSSPDARPSSRWPKAATAGSPKSTACFRR